MDLLISLSINYSAAFACDWICLFVLQYFLNNNILDGFELYYGLDGLYSMFANETLLLFWLHFLSISLFAGAWIVRDSKKYLIPKIVTIPSLS